MGIDVITKPGIRLTRRVREMQVSPTLAVMNRALELKAQGGRRRRPRTGRA